MSPLNAAICTTISYALWVEWYYIKTIICTHIPNIIDLPWKTKMLWHGQENTI